MMNSVSSLAALGVALTTCSVGAPPKPSSAPTTATTSPAAGARPAGPTHPTAGDAPRGRGAPSTAADLLPDLDEVTDARPYAFRELGVGMIVTPHRRTSILRRAGDQASLRVTVETAPHTFDSAAPPPWKRVTTETFVGGIRRDARTTTFDLRSAAGKRLKLWCRAGRLAVHGQGAWLVRTPRVPGRYYSECSEQGVWRPRATQTIDVLSCEASDRTLDDHGQFGFTTLQLAPLPGVESVFVNDDCLLQGGGYRRMSSND